MEPHLEPLEADGELALGEGECVSEVEPSVHVGVGEGHQELVVRAGGGSVRRRVLLEDVLRFPSLKKRTPREVTFMTLVDLKVKRPTI